MDEHVSQFAIKPEKHHLLHKVYLLISGFYNKLLVIFGGFHQLARCYSFLKLTSPYIRLGHQSSRG